MKLVKLDASTKENRDFIESLLGDKYAAQEGSETDQHCCCCDSEDDSMEEDEELDSMLEQLFNAFTDALDNNLKTTKTAYSFQEMIEEFTSGYKSTFVNNDTCFAYDNGSKTLLVKSGPNVYPAAIVPSLFKDKFYKSKVYVSNEKALKLVIDGQKMNFEVNSLGDEITGSIEMKNDVPSYRINEKNVPFRPEVIVLCALLQGKWYM